jgi:hypothetical protein
MTHRKVAITIYLAVLSVSLPVNLYLRPLLLSSGLSKLEAFFTGACIISIGMVYFTSPLVSYLARPFLRPWPTKLFDRLTQVIQHQHIYSHIMNMIRCLSSLSHPPPQLTPSQTTPSSNSPILKY